MNMQLITLGGTAVEDANRAAPTLRGMTQEQLLNLGVYQVVYVRARAGDSGLVFQILGADGTPIATVETLEEAVLLAADQGLSFVTIH